MDLGIKDLRVLVTAGANGIGLKTVEAFLREGARVHTCDIDASALAKLSKAYPQVTTTVCDVADRASVTKLVDEAVSTLGGLDCLVNNAGIAGPTGPVYEIAPEDWDRCLQVTLTSQFNCTRLVVAHLRKSSNASIINLSSAAGRFGFPNRSAYSAAKWGVIGFTKTISMELGQFGVRCNAILPGPVWGERIRQVIDAKAKLAGRPFEEVENEMVGKASVKEFIQPEQLADMMVFLASPLARTISGQAISIDGDLQALI